jgi:hypothetical protein
VQRSQRLEKIQAVHFPALCTKSAKKNFPSRRHVHETSDFSPEVSTDQRVYHVNNFGKIAGRRVHETV